MKPQRIVLSRRKGFNLQASSWALNGLAAQSVARPGPWGNSFTIDDMAAELGLGRKAAQSEAVSRHGRWLQGEILGSKPAPSRAKIQSELGGKNLACWCPAGTPCHVHNLLIVANE